MAAVINRLYDLTLLVIGSKATFDDIALSLDVLQKNVGSFKAISILDGGGLFGRASSTQEIEDLMRGFDALFFDDPSLSRFLPSDYRGLVIYHHHDDLPADPITSSRGRMQWLDRFRLVSSRGDSVEYMLRRADVIFRESGSRLNETAPLQPSTTRLPFSFDETLLELQGPETVSSPTSLLFVSDNDDSSTRNAIHRFLDDDWQQIRADHPGLKLHLSVKSPHLLSEPLIKAAGDVDVSSFRC